jgi:hypothetical protein
MTFNDSKIQTMLGTTVSDCEYVFDSTPLTRWRDWITPLATKSQYQMYWNLFHVEALLKSSPSGKVIFPEFIDATKPLIIKDVSTDNWVGLFLPTDNEKEHDKIKIPKWWV